MLKFAFLINVPGQSPQTYSAVYENSESYSLLAGVNGVEEGPEYLKELISQGYTLINLCGDFDDEITEKMQADAGEEIKIANAKYSLNELAKLNQLESADDYGIIIKMDGVENPETVCIESEECKTTAIFVKDMEQAKEAAVYMAEQNINLIELCSWFDKLMMEDIVEAIDGVVPVGTCGNMEIKITSL